MIFPEDLRKVIWVEVEAILNCSQWVPRDVELSRREIGVADGDWDLVREGPSLIDMFKGSWNRHLKGENLDVTPYGVYYKRNHPHYWGDVWEKLKIKWEAMWADMVKYG